MVTVTLSSTNHPPSTSTTVLTIVDLDSLAKKGYEIEQFSPLLTITCSAFKWRHNKDNYKHKNKVPYRIFFTWMYIDIEPETVIRQNIK